MKEEKTYQLQIYVLTCLQSYPITRDDDFQLVLSVWRELNPSVANIPLKKVMENHKEYGLPSFESITRARRKMQNIYPRLRASKEVEQARAEEEEEHRRLYR